MSQKNTPHLVSRRALLVGAAAAAATAGVRAAQAPGTSSQTQSALDVERFIQDCRHACDSHAADAQAAVREVLARAISNPRAVLKGVGEPQKGGIRPLYRSPGLTILNIVWSPLMQLMPHEHNMWSLIGIYTGREDNIFWERKGTQVSAVSASALSAGSVTPLPQDVIHSVTNPIEKLTGAIHIYGGDFFAVRRSEWDPDSLTERDWNLERAVRLFEESNERFSSRPPGRVCQAEQG